MDCPWRSWWGAAQDSHPRRVSGVLDCDGVSVARARGARRSLCSAAALRQVAARSSRPRSPTVRRRTRACRLRHAQQPRTRRRPAWTSADWNESCRQSSNSARRRPPLLSTTSSWRSRASAPRFPPKRTVARAGRFSATRAVGPRGQAAGLPGAGDPRQRGRVPVPAAQAPAVGLSHRSLTREEHTPRQESSSVCVRRRPR